MIDMEMPYISLKAVIYVNDADCILLVHPMGVTWLKEYRLFKECLRSLLHLDSANKPNGHLLGITYLSDCG